jgi:hypothetical protein
MTLLACLQAVPDARSRHRREYPLAGLLAVLVLAAAHGENSLRGMWLWGKERVQVLRSALPSEVWPKAKFPALGTFWYALQKLDAGVLEAALQGWVKEERGYVVDGKHLRGSKREGAQALQVLILAGQQWRQVLRQVAVPDGDEMGAAIRLLATVDVEGKVVSADAGILKAPFVQEVVKKGGATLAGSKTTNQS